MSGWLSDRLSPVKIDTDRWLELAEAIEEFWASEFDPGVEFLRSLRSVFLAGPEGQALILKNLGDYFYEDNLPTDNIPMSVMWRQHELYMKQTVSPLENTLQRVGSQARWEPLWVLETDMYDDMFFFTGAEIRKTIYLDGTWKVKDPTDKRLWPTRYLTSRGVLQADLNAIANYGDLDIIRHRAAMLRPANIVIDGFRYSGAGTQTLASPEQPRLDVSWAVEDGTTVLILAYLSSHDDILSKIDTARAVFGHSTTTLVAMASAPAVFTDYGNSIEFTGVLHNSECIGYSIGAAGLMIDGVVYAPISFPFKIKAPDDSYTMTFTLIFE